MTYRQPKFILIGYIIGYGFIAFAMIYNAAPILCLAAYFYVRGR